MTWTFAGARKRWFGSDTLFSRGSDSSISIYQCTLSIRCDGRQH